MPELPEVQTVVSQLAESVVGHTITHFSSEWPRKVRLPITEVLSRTAGAKITATERLGKHIVIHLSTGYSIVIHLKMTGHLLYKTAANRHEKRFITDPVNGYIHHIFTLDDDCTLEFSDMRKFGWVDVVPTAEVRSMKSIAALGVDAISNDFALEYFRSLCLKYKSKLIGALLLDQGLIAGIGNIYRSEALYRSGIRPFRRAGSLSVAERAQLHAMVREVLGEAVELRGTTDGDFRDLDGRPGGFQDTLYVYGRTGEPCKVCGTLIIRQKLGSRSVFVCTNCQK